MMLFKPKLGVPVGWVSGPRRIDFAEDVLVRREDVVMIIYTGRKTGFQTVFSQ